MKGWKKGREALAGRRTAAQMHVTSAAACKTREPEVNPAGSAATFCHSCDWAWLCFLLVAELRLQSSKN